MTFLQRLYKFSRLVFRLKFLTFIVICLFISTSMQGQFEPSNDACEDATELIPNKELSFKNNHFTSDDGSSNELRGKCNI